MKTFQFSDDFLLGTATSSLQIEGGDTNNSWYRWAQQGHIQDGTHCIVACDHYNRVAEDIALMQKLHSNSYRLSLEWSRIEPQKDVWDEKAIAHYRQELEKLQAAGIAPMVTLHHFSNPLWLEDSGSWVNPEVVERFSKYAQYVAEQLGDLVTYWVTINEPNIYLVFGYIRGIWPPGRKGDIRSYFQGARNMTKAIIHKVCKSPQVGVAHHLRLFDPKNGTLLEQILCHRHYKNFQDIFVEGMTRGKWLSPLGFNYFLEEGSYADFLGINYYSRDIVSFAFNPTELFAKVEVNAPALTNDLGWEIYPKGLYRVCKKYYDRFKLPIYITENGICDNKDTYRKKFIYEHLLVVSQLLQEGVPVKGYYHWSLLDNFEWVEGLGARFGLIEVDFETQQRKIKDSGLFYGEICQNKGVTAGIIEKHLG